MKSHMRTYSAWGMNQILEVLRILTSVRYNDPLAVFNRLALSDAIYLLEYRLLSLEDTAESDLGLRGIFRLAVFIYIDRVLREMPPLNLGVMVTRLVGAVKVIVDFGPTELLNSHLLAILLWALFIGRVASHDADEKEYFLEGLIYVCECLDIRQNYDFRKCLDSVGPALQPFGAQFEEAWVAIEELNNDRSL